MNNVYTIPEDHREEVEKLVAKYQRKANKYGIPMEVEFSKPFITKVPVYDIDENGTITRRYNEFYTFEAFNLTIDGEIIKKDGYTVIAKIEHLQGGNIVTTFKGDTKAEWRTMDCRCEHCGKKRDRRLTFMVRHEDGTEKQVGRTCLKDYCGIDPQRIGIARELDELIIGFDVRKYDFNERPVSPAYTTIDILALAIRAKKKQGYVSTDEIGSNKSIIAEWIINDRPTDAEIEEARAMADEIVKASKDDAIRYLLDNTQSLIHNTYCKKNHFGFIAYAPTAFDKYTAKLKQRADREAEREAQAKSSNYVGNVGERLTFDIATMTLVTRFENQFGYTYLYKFTDTNGNVLVWFASKPFKHVNANGVYEDVTNVNRIKATVKDHSERDGIKQTVITRCKVA